MTRALLHGTLHITINEAHSLTRTLIDKIVENVESCFGKDAGKLYVTVDLEEVTLGRTRLIEHIDSNPRWYQDLHIYCAHTTSNIVFTLKKENDISVIVLGRAHLSVSDILDEKEVDTWLDILNEHGELIHMDSKLNVKIKFSGVNNDVFWDKGIQTPAFAGVPLTFYKQRNHCKVTLYQDAHDCWKDVFNAINNAKNLIYIAGWSVYTEITLVRDTGSSSGGGDTTLGELLKKKAEEGVRVLMLVWNDRTSRKRLNNDGLLDTHDQETATYFEGSKVHCVLCPRNPGDGENIVQDIEMELIFTHHQKILVVDGEYPSTRGSMIVSFIGGIDLCDGRYDTQSHSLFRTLNTTNRNDFHQPNFKESSLKKGGPREPWHDIHSRLEGSIAWDVLETFEQRWKKQGGEEPLFDLQDDIFISPTKAFVDDKESWNVQLFRSIDSKAASGLSKSLQEDSMLGLVNVKDNIIERSIQDAYIHAIRRAKRFIYIENQYFLGSSFDWKATDIDPKIINALNLIPKELSLKIVSKIKKGERFTVYIVLPMWPEGLPDSGSVQAILDWQRRTMEMLYGDVVEALRAKGVVANPKEYLLFFCLGNREVKKSGEYEPEEHPEPGSNYANAQEHRRFMIYVHAKIMIVDDEYIILGSANLNQRSLDGARDTEIAMGGFQPNHIANRDQPATGQIHKFRMSLWKEHMGMVDESFKTPESIECVNMVNKIAYDNWEHYASETLQNDLPGHLLRYPVQVTEEGNIVELTGLEHFPDTKGRILGTKSDILPPILTT